MPDKIVWKIDDPNAWSTSHETAPRTATHPLGIKKNPALAFSLSLLFWGSGQLYNQQRAVGILFFLLMINFYMALGLIIIYWEFMISFLKTVLITPSEVFIACGLFYLSGLIFWIVNALQAYQQASRTHTYSFEGVKNFFLPLFCSLLIPGWGQFLNGQPKKGSFFLIFTLAGFFAFPTLVFIAMLWPSLETFNDRYLLENVLVFALALSPPVFLMWLLNVYDALKVSLDPLKKEPLRDRVKYAINRLRIRGWARGVLPQAKLTLMLFLFLTLSVTLGYYYLPGKNYVAMLQNLQTRLYQQKMILLPYLIDQFLQAAFPQELHR